MSLGLFFMLSFMHSDSGSSSADSIKNYSVCSVMNLHGLVDARAAI
jgi:hypothetical protein